MYESEDLLKLSCFAVYLYYQDIYFVTENRLWQRWLPQLFYLTVYKGALTTMMEQIKPMDIEKRSFEIIIELLGDRNLDADH